MCVYVCVFIHFVSDFATRVAMAPPGLEEKKAEGEEEKAAEEAPPE